MNRKKSLMLSIFGAVITGFAVGSFLVPNKIVGGGASGISIILFHTFGIPPGISFFVMNILFLLIGLALLGKDFISKALVGIIFVSIFTQIFSSLPIHTDNIILATVFGGALSGLGIGMSFATGFSTGGTDVVGRIIQSRLSSVPIGKLLLIIDGIVIAVSFFAFRDVELILFGVLSLIISSYCIDLIINKLNVSKIAFVISDKGEEISNTLISTSPRGVTMFDVKGAYSNENKKMLFCALKESETAEFQKKILSIDKTAFIVFSEAQRIKGKGFYLYK